MAFETSVIIFFFFSFRHVSKFRDNAKEEYTKQKVDHKTMGQAKVPVRQPESFMKKHEREPVLPDSKKILDHIFL